MSSTTNKITLTDRQEEVIEGILEDIELGDSARVVLCGYAGTGKTVTTAALVSMLTGMKKRVVVATPTHKARAQVERALTAYGASHFECVTIHRLLGLKLVRNYETGEETFEPEYGKDNMLTPVSERKYDKGKGEIDVVIVDETSMVQAKLYDMLNEHAGDRPVVFVGDDRQLLPVKEDEPCRAFIECEKVYRLEDVLRHDGAILNLATATRELPVGRAKFEDAVGGGTRVVAYRSREEWMEALLEIMESPEALNDPDYCRVLGFTNRTVDSLNEKIHVARYGEGAPEFKVGMTCVTSDAVADPVTGGPLIHSTVDFTIEETEEEMFRAPGDNEDEPEWKTWKMDVAVTMDGKVHQIRVLQKEEQARWKKAQKEIADRAKNTSSKRERSAMWKLYFQRRDQFARIAPASALTIHKSQGSTFSHVYLHWDIDGFGVNQQPTAMQNQLAYVGITRAAESLHVVMDRFARPIALPELQEVA